MKKREASFGVLFRHWIRSCPIDYTANFELKQTSRDSIPFSCVEDHQIDYADAVKNSKTGVLMRNQGGNGEPDYTFFYREPTFIVIKYPGFFCLIDYRTFVQEKITSKRKSLTADRAAEIASYVVRTTSR